MNVLLQVLQGGNLIATVLPTAISGIEAIIRLLKPDPAVTVQLVDIQTGAITKADGIMAKIEAWRASQPKQ